MKTKYKEYKQLDLPGIASEVLKDWEDARIFEKSIEIREGAPSFVFYEGPPSANGLPGIHHVMARTIKDLFCRFHTMQGRQVKRKAGWDTHGLPIELSVEKTLGITKEDIGKKISIEDYNKACRKEVMKYKDVWDDLTRKIGFWVDLSDPYITFDNEYIESVWWLLKRLYDKDLLYKGFTIQPFSPAAGTGLSSHELNQPGCYKNVKDTTIVAQFKLVRGSLPTVRSNETDEVFFLAWTTTPWTLPSNTALAVGANITYVKVQTFNPYTYKPIQVILAKDLFPKYFPEKNASLKPEDYTPGDKNIPFTILDEFKGKELEGLRYEQLLPYAQPKDGDAFRVVLGDFVSTEEGTGIVHIAPTFGADDFRVAIQNNIPPITVKRLSGAIEIPLVDRQGRFVEEVKDSLFPFAGKYVKAEYYTEEEKRKELLEQQEKLKSLIPNLDKYLSVDELIALKLKIENKAFRIEKYEHNYPHCWRTDKPVLYYPLDSWFVRTTAMKERMVELNNTINWKPESTGTGRFGNWLENLVDWNLSRSRFWGIPLPIWATEDKKEMICIGSVEELQKEIEKSVKAGFMKVNPIEKTGNYKSFDLHRPYVDDIILTSATGKEMRREPDLIDVWFDSGAMPYAQWHYPFENQEIFKKNFPADFIAEGVDQTRGWFYTLHAIAAMCFDSVAFKNVVSNGLVLDKNGNKMSKRLGNAIDPFETIGQFGADATRWYMVTNAPPWDNLKFDLEGVKEIQRKFFGTLYNTYAFFALYANIDGFDYSEKEIPVSERPEIDRWILAELNSLIAHVTKCYETYEPHLAGRAIEDFVDNLSNWHIRLSRRRFWKSENNRDKNAAYQTLYTCLETIARLAAPVAPFFMDRLFCDLNRVTKRANAESVHLADFPKADTGLLDNRLQEKMKYARQVSSMALSIRKKENIKVRQPLGKIRIAVLNDTTRSYIEAVKELILSEINVKELEFVSGESAQLIKKLKLNFKSLGKKYPKLMKAIQAHTAQFEQPVIRAIETGGKYPFTAEGEEVVLEAGDVEIIPVDIPGWKIASMGDVTAALDMTITDQLREEGIARELINRIQNLRKDNNFEVTDKIDLKIQSHKAIDRAISNNLNYICSETLAASLEMVPSIPPSDGGVTVEVDDNILTFITVKKHQNGKN